MTTSHENQESESSNVVNVSKAELVDQWFIVGLAVKLILGAFCIMYLFKGKHDFRHYCL